MCSWLGIILDWKFLIASPLNMNVGEKILLEFTSGKGLILISDFVGADAEFHSEAPFLLKSYPLISLHKCLHAFLSTLFFPFDCFDVADLEAHHLKCWYRNPAGSGLRQRARLILTSDAPGSVAVLNWKILIWARPWLTGRRPLQLAGALPKDPLEAR